jgi:hypothetical protein
VGEQDFYPGIIKQTLREKKVIRGCDLAKQNSLRKRDEKVFSLYAGLLE